MHREGLGIVSETAGDLDLGIEIPDRNGLRVGELLLDEFRAQRRRQAIVRRLLRGVADPGHGRRIDQPGILDERRAGRVDPVPHRAVVGEDEGGHAAELQAAIRHRLGADDRLDAFAALPQPGGKARAGLGLAAAELRLDVGGLRLRHRRQRIVEEGRRGRFADVSFGTIALVSALRIPAFIEQAFPFVILFSSIFTLLTLNKKLELVVAR
ncbi:MAG: LptF/LptG family permease, partial [Hyphomicrobiales bacterium]